MDNFQTFSQFLSYTVIFKKIILFSKKKYVFNIIIKTFNIL